MIFAIVNDFIIKEVRSLSEEEIGPLSRVNQCVVQIEGMVPMPQVGWILNGTSFVPPVTQDMAELVCLTIYDPMVLKLAKIRRRFIGENILWGITEQGKTRAVAEFMEPIETWFNRAATTEVIVEIEAKKNELMGNPVLASQLAPFVTMERLNWYKAEILKAAGLG